MYNIHGLRIPDCSKMVIGNIKFIVGISMKKIDKSQM